MLKKLSHLFEALSECVLAALDGEIIYRNTAARQIDAFASAKLSELLPEFIINDKAQGYIAEAIVGDEPYAVSCTFIDETAIYVFRQARGGKTKHETDILASISMSLREPLSVMNLAAGQLLPFAEIYGDEKISEYASMMHRSIFSVIRALNRLDALLFLAGETVGEVERTSVDIRLLTKELVDTVTQVLELEQGRLKLFFETDNARVLGDKRLIERMLLCLIGNALIFSPDDTNIKITVKMPDNKAIITVTDNGGGISDDKRFDIWSRYNAKRELNDTKSGAGFGLSVVQAIARMHGGSALIDSQAGSGTTVIVSLAETPEEGIVPVFDAPQGYSTVNDMREIFTELVNIIPRKKFSEKYMD